MTDILQVPDAGAKETGPAAAGLTGPARQPWA
jgi:hypothetical protein